MACRNHPKEQREWQGNTRLCDVCAETEGSRLYDEQEGKCAICGKLLGPRNAKGGVPSSAQLDHDRQSGQIRGVLCRGCNLGLGHFKDDPRMLRTAAVYLEKWRQMDREQ